MTTVVTRQMNPRPRTRTRAAIRPEQIAQHRTPDVMDEEFDASVAEERPIRPEAAHPEPPPPIPEEDRPMHGMNSYEREHRLKLLHRLLLRNISGPTIMQQMNLSHRAFHLMRAELNNRLKQEAKNVDTYSFFGKTMAFYDEVRGQALRMATATEIAAGVRVSALATSLAADQAKLRFLELAGFFDHNRFAPPPLEEADSVEAGRKRLGLLLQASRKTLEGSEDVSYAIEDADDADRFNDDIEML